MTSKSTTLSRIILRRKLKRNSSIKSFKIKHKLYNNKKIITLRNINNIQHQKVYNLKEQNK